MKEAPISTCERTFITQAIKQNQRLDGRKNDEFRSLKVNYGADWGSVIVALGGTKVLAQVSGELGEPKATRPTEGMLYINVELGPMAAPHFEAGRNSELTVQVTRTLERTFKDSRCIDLESLCIIAEERVWILRVDLNVLNHEGNLIDCCSIATLCALAHFRRPDVSIIEDEVHIHTAAEKEPIPMVMHHYPVCVSYCTFDDGRMAVADPTVIEERTSESQMVFGINSYRELCCLNLGGSSLTSSVLLLQCSKRAANHAKNVVDYIKQTLEEDQKARESNKNVGFTEFLRENTLGSFEEDRLVLRLRNFSFEDLKVESTAMAEETSEKANNDDKGLRENNVYSENEVHVKWVPDEEEDDDDDENITNMYSDNGADDDSNEGNLDQVVKETIEHSNLHSKPPVKKGKRKLQSPPLNHKHLEQSTQSDSEEEEQLIL